MAGSQIFEPEEARCWIQRVEVGEALGLRPTVARKRVSLFAELLDRGEDERADGALQDELHQDLVRVEGAGASPHRLVGHDLHLAIVLGHLILQQALVDRAKLLHREVAIVDALAAVARQSV
jgi:hypothetical protein